MKRIFSFFLFMSLLVPVVSGSEYFFMNSQEPGSHYFWQYGRLEGSKYFWDYGQKAGSEYFWKYGRKVGSKYFWDNGRDPGSMYYWLNGREAGSRYYWENGRGPGSLKYWRTGKKMSFLPFFVTMCKTGSITIDPCEQINAPDLLDALMNLTQQQPPALNSINPINVNDSELLKDIQPTRRIDSSNLKNGAGKQ